MIEPDVDSFGNAVYPDTGYTDYNRPPQRTTDTPYFTESPRAYTDTTTTPGPQYIPETSKPDRRLIVYEDGIRKVYTDGRRDYDKEERHRRAQCEKAGVDYDLRQQLRAEFQASQSKKMLDQVARDFEYRKMQKDQKSRDNAENEQRLAAAQPDQESWAEIKRSIEDQKRWAAIDRLRQEIRENMVIRDKSWNPMVVLAARFREWCLRRDLIKVMSVNYCVYRETFGAYTATSLLPAPGIYVMMRDYYNRIYGYFAYKSTNLVAVNNPDFGYFECSRYVGYATEEADESISRIIV
jgi:hypothetical protein